MSLVAVNGSPSSTSKTHALAAAAVDLAGGGDVINIGDLDAGALLLRGKDASVTDAIDAVTAARPLVLVTPVYRAYETSADFAEDGAPLPSVLDPMREALEEAARLG